MAGEGADDLGLSNLGREEDGAVCSRTCSAAVTTPHPHCRNPRHWIPTLSNEFLSPIWYGSPKKLKLCFTQGQRTS